LKKFHNLLGSFPKIFRDVNSRKKNKIKNRKLALKFAKDYFDGSRSSGYGGYYYDGRWVKIAKSIIKRYKLKTNSKFLDVGCAKGFLMHDIQKVSKNKIKVYGVDISRYAKSHALPSIKKKIKICDCKKLPFKDNFFDFVISVNTIHNLSKNQCIQSLKEIQRVSKGKAFVQVDAYTNKREYKKFLDWMLTAKTFLTPDKWKELFNKAGYSGDYYWTILKKNN
jgi:ubiquinone/menaquinone biosynthesis C-methylase UbiE